MAEVEWQIEPPRTEPPTVPPSSRHRLRADVVRLGLVVLAFALLWGAERVRTRLETVMSNTFTAPWGLWVAGLAVLAAAGFAFGLAALLPRRPRYRVARAAVLASLPLLVMAHLTMTLGPPAHSTAQHLQFLDRILANFELDIGAKVAPVFLGVALAAGFEPRPHQAGER